MKLSEIDYIESKMTNGTSTRRDETGESISCLVKDKRRSNNSNIVSGGKRDSEIFEPISMSKKLKENKETKDKPVSSFVLNPDKTIQDKESANGGGKSKSPKIEDMNSMANKSAEMNQNIDHNFLLRIALEEIPDVEALPALSAREVAELELSLQIGSKFIHGDENSWRDDWSGNLQLVEKELVMNMDKIAQNPNVKPVVLPFCEWVAQTSTDKDNLRGINLLFSYVYHMNGTPAMTKKLMSYSLKRPAKTTDERLKFILDAVKRISYDPTVLTQDGWTIKKPDTPDSLSGGSYLIGRRIIWQKYEAIIIAFVRDDEIGDLWKAMWLDDNDTVDLEADELQEALTKWEKKNSSQQKKNLVKRIAKPEKTSSKQTGSARFEATRNFSVKSIEHGIILATSYSARNGVPWPARVMHSSEVKELGLQSSSRRSSSKNEIQVVFLAPYWNGQYSQSFRNKGSLSNNHVESATNIFSTGSLLELETIDVSEDTVQTYPYDISDGTISIDKLRSSFSFLCLPKAAFPRFLDSHRLALAFKAFAKRDLSKVSNSLQSHSSRADAFASLTDCHPLQVQTFLFPSAILNLPYDYILNQLPHPNEKVSQLVGDGEEMTEPILHLHTMLKIMTPPHCWGIGFADEGKIMDSNQIESILSRTPQSARQLTPIKSPSLVTISNDKDETSDSVGNWSLSNFSSEYLINAIGGNTGNMDVKCIALLNLGKELRDLLYRFQHDTRILENNNNLKWRIDHMRSLLLFCLSVKGHGENILLSSNIPNNLNVRNLTIEWRKACERLYKKGTSLFCSPGCGTGVTRVITDSRCNQHLTAIGSFERPVRVPAAIRGAKFAGAGRSDNFPLITIVDEKIMELTEKKILPMAHKAEYLKKIKLKISALPNDVRGAPLTDESEGEGGEDTLGSRGSYTAAVAAVAAAIQGVDMIFSGQCTNAFCAVRPPGHHAGKALHAMNASSNGFCLLNAAACAALYATTAQSDGGLGLKRVCVIDFDVHHGNGTQDILCATHDPRFLYVSTHAGGAHINGYDDEDSDDAYRRSHGYSRCEGIFPGRCGDTSPHSGVLNIPLGLKVTAQAIGNALVSRVSPAVEAFSPDLVIISAGFDAHRNDPLGMGGLTAQDFGSVTSVICHMALKSCSGRVLSILEGGYGVPCCQPNADLFLPKSTATSQGMTFSLGDDLPENMVDRLDPSLHQKVEKCKQEGFLDCVREHVGSLAKYNNCSK